MNLQLAQVYLMHGDPALTGRTWQNVMEQMSELKSGNTLRRWQTAMRDPAFDLIRQRKLIETTAEHFLAVLKAGSVSTNMFLRRIIKHDPKDIGGYDTVISAKEFQETFVNRPVEAK